MNRNASIFAAVLIMILPLGIFAQKSDSKLTDFVNPFIGTGPIDSNSLSGSNFPGATTPFGFVQLSPDTKDMPDDPCSGYDYNDKNIYGFSHTHLSGTGVPDLFDVLLMPATGDFKPDTNKSNMSSGIYFSRYSHDKESAKPGYYQVTLLDYNINAELTATEHAGFHRYTFPQSAQSHILIDLNHKCKFWESRKIWAQIRVIDNTTVEGCRIMTGWTEGYRKIYFRAEFSKPFNSNVMIDGANKHDNLSLVNGREEVKALLNFNTAANEQILVKVGLSSVSIENARLNLAAEIPDWNFDKISDNTLNQWNRELECISIDGTKEQKEIFYTGLYHAFIQPNNIADVNGDYPATDMTVRNAPDKKHYSTFSLWDTYRATNPLYTRSSSQNEQPVLLTV